jgi:hypothetical protein
MASRVLRYECTALATKEAGGAALILSLRAAGDDG